MTSDPIQPGIWRREFFATRTSAHVAFAVLVWPLLTVIGTTIALIEDPYFPVSFSQAFQASLAGTILSVPDMLVVGAIFFGSSGLIFSRLGPDTLDKRFGFARLGVEPLLMFVAVVWGTSLWYPAVLSQPLLAPLRNVPITGIMALLLGTMILGAAVAGKPGKRARLAATLIAIGALSPSAPAVRTALGRFAGSPPTAIVLGVDSVSHANDIAQFTEWVKSRCGAWYDHPVAPGLLTNSVWASILTTQPVRAHRVFHTFQPLPPGTPAFIGAARASGYRTISIFPDQLTCAVGSRAGFDEDRSGPVGWRQVLLPTVVNNSWLVPVLKPALPNLWPTVSRANQGGTFTYDVRREIREILRAGSPGHRTLVAAHLTYTHLPAFPTTLDLSWGEIWSVAHAAAGTVQDRSFDWQDVDRPSDPIKLHAWKLNHLQRLIAAEVEAAQYLEHGGRLIVFSDHGDRVGLGIENFKDERYHHVLLATFGLPERCLQEPISLIDIASLLGLSGAHAVPSVEFTLAPTELWPVLMNGARLRWSGDVELDGGLLAEIFKSLQRHDPWRGRRHERCERPIAGPVQCTGANQRFCGSALKYLPTITYPRAAK